MFLATMFRVIWASRKGILLVVVLTLLGGEALMRLPFIPQRLEYAPDPDFGGRLAPDQKGYIWLANASMQGPTITLNQDGFRGAALDAAGPLVLVLGDSEAFGAGVGDADLWTTLLEADLRARPGLESVRIANAAHPGHGPSHLALEFDRILKRRVPDLLILQVAVGQSGFWLVPEDQRPAAYAAAKQRARVRAVTKFAPFLVDKALAQRDGFIRILPFRVGPPAGAGTDIVARARRLDTLGRPYWNHMLEEARARGIPVLLLLWYSIDEAAGNVVYAELRDLAGDDPGVRAARLTPEDFGIDSAAPDALEEYRQRYTLRRDPHTNALFHRGVARRVSGILAESGLADALGTRAAAEAAR